MFIPILMCLPVFSFRVTPLGPAVWIIWINHLRGFMSMARGRCFSFCNPAKPSLWLARVLPQIMGWPWLMSWVVLSPRRAGPCSAGLRKVSMLQRIVVVWQGMVHPSLFSGHRWTVFIPPITARFKSRWQNKGS